jgi:hypothetical protein
LARGDGQRQQARPAADGWGGGAGWPHPAGVLPAGVRLAAADLGERRAAVQRRGFAGRLKVRADGAAGLVAALPRLDVAEGVRREARPQRAGGRR